MISWTEDTPNPLKHIGQVIEFHLDNSKFFSKFFFLQFSVTTNSQTEMKSNCKPMVALSSETFQTFSVYYSVIYIHLSWKVSALMSQSWLKSFRFSISLFVEKFWTAWELLRMHATITNCFYYSSAGCCTNKIRSQFLLCFLQSRTGLSLE